MSRTRAIALTSTFVALLLAPQLAAAQDKSMSIADWPEVAKKAFKEMQAKYGHPQGATPTRIVWTDKGPFREIILLNEAIDHDFPKPHKDCLEHVVNYDVPKEKVGELAQFDGSIIVDRTRGTLSARCDSEAHNLVALNLAHDIITGKKSVEEARKAYTKGAEMEMAGKPLPPIAHKLMFEPQPKAGDSDVVTVNKQQGEPQPAGATEQKQEQRQSERQTADDEDRKN